MGLVLTRLWTVWLARTRRRLPSRSSSERSLASNCSRDALEESTSIDNDSIPLQSRELPILDGGSPINTLPQDLLLRYVDRVFVLRHHWLIDWCPSLPHTMNKTVLWLNRHMVICQHLYLAQLECH